jgi:hypothetical protein
MPHHDERTANALAHGAAKPDDIERARRDIGAATARSAPPVPLRARPRPAVDRAVGEMETACQTLHTDLDELKRAIGPEPERARRDDGRR